MKGKKVLYHKGDNQKYDYFIVAEKSEITLDKNSLAYKFDPTSDKETYIDTGIAKGGNFDFLIAEHFKDGDYIRPIFCDSSDIKIL